MRIVIPSLNYGDILADSLPAWCRVAGAVSLTVVTAKADRHTQDVARAQGVRCVVTEAWTHDGAILNKALALDEGFGFVPGFTDPPKDGDVCLSIDADSYPMGRLPDETVLEPRVLYSVWRHECLTPSDLDAHVAGTLPLSHFVRMKNNGGKPVGYFQMFRWWPSLRFGSHPTAAKYDIRFRELFPRYVMLEQPYLLHLGPGNIKANWRGRVVPAWRVA